MNPQVGYPSQVPSGQAAAVRAGRRAAAAQQGRTRWLGSDGGSVLTAIPFVGAAVGVYVLLDNLWLLWDRPNQQCVHDKYAKTIVVTAADG